MNSQRYFVVYCLNTWKAIPIKKKKKKKKTKKKKNKQIQEVSELEAYKTYNPCSLKTTRHEPKINMAERLVDFIVKLWQRWKKDRPPKLLRAIPASLTFQQMLEKEVLVISNITASYRVGFKNLVSDYLQTS